MASYAIWFNKSPSALMRLMNEFLTDFIGKFVILYLDDILIYIQSKKERLKNLRLVLRRLQQEKLSINLMKCSFMKTELVFWGFVISQGGLKMDLEKVKEIVQWSSPRNIYEVRSFHGLASFYRKFIKNFNNICVPILETIKRDNQPFEWTESIERGFGLLKYKITDKPILALPYFQKLFEVKCHTSGMVVGVVLSQEERPIACFSQKLNDANQKYSSYHKEFYAFIHALKKWRHYLMLKEFVLYIDNHALQFFSRKEMLNQRHVKWIKYM